MSAAKKAPLSNEAQRGEIADANERAGSVTKRWFKAAKDQPSEGKPQITRHERIQLRRLIALEILHARGWLDVTIADLP